MRKGLDENIIRYISAVKKEPDWMLKFRLDSFKNFKKHKMPNFGPDLSFIDFSSYTYFSRELKNAKTKWSDVPNKIKNVFNKIGIPEAEQKFLSGVTAQYGSEAIYNNLMNDLKKKGVIFLSTDQAVQQYPELVKKYIGKVVSNNDNKFAALNGAVWSGGVFIYIPKGIHIDKPLQSYFRINDNKFGQFERTLIIVDEGASVHYLEGCSAPIFSNDSLHAGVVEIFVLKNAKCRYSTVQNWSTNVINLVTKRAVVNENGKMEWIDGNIGSAINMKYPACILKEKKAVGFCVSVAIAAEKQQLQDAGARMIHLAPDTHSTILSKSIASNGGVANYRGTVRHSRIALNSSSHVECDTLLLDERSESSTIPKNEIFNNQSYIEHEAFVSKISEEKLFYLMSRGIDKKKAIQLIIVGFIAPFSNELPLEYAVEFNRLIKTYF
ncbi:MAG: Fe-S cluster assembly protein SufB [Bacilli bacterium]|nr:Fe-S cluster assembly protein SufB [Bacilli bacterium]